MPDRRAHMAGARGSGLRGLDAALDRARDGGVLVVLAGMAGCGSLGAAIAGFSLTNPLLLDAALTLAISTCVLAGVVLEQRARALREDAGAGTTPSRGRKSRRSKRARP